MDANAAGSCQVLGHCHTCHQTTSMALNRVTGHSFGQTHRSCALYKLQNTFHENSRIQLEHKGIPTYQLIHTALDRQWQLNYVRYTPVS